MSLEEKLKDFLKNEKIKKEKEQQLMEFLF